MTENETLPNPFAASQQQTVESSDLEGLERESVTNNAHIPNFPSFYPVVYVDLNAEIPHNFWSFFKLMYVSALSFTGACIFQIFVQFFGFAINYHWFKCPIKDVFMSLVLAVFLPILLFSNQYYSFYCSIRDENPNFRFGLLQTFVIAALLIIIIGIPGSGCVGIWWLDIAANYGSAASVLFGVLVTIWHIINLILQFVVLIIHRTHDFSYNGRISNPADV